MTEEQQTNKPRRFDPADLVGLGGLALITAGAWMAWHPAAPLVVGAVLFVYAWVKSKA